MKPVIALATAGLLLAGPALAQRAPGDAPSSSQAPAASSAAPEGTRTTGVNPAAAPTPDFVRKVAIGDLFELQASRLAKSKQIGAEFTAFADKMIADHSHTSDMLKTFVSTGVVKAELPTALDQEHAQMLQQLQSQSGQQFEQTFKAQQIQAHQTAIQLFAAYGRNGDNQELRQWAAATVPNLREHLALAERLQPTAATTSQAPAQAPRQ